MTDAVAKIWPVDFTSLKKGDVVNGAELARAWGFDLAKTVDSDKFKLKVLALSEEINRETADRGLVAQVRKGDIHVLADNEYVTRQKKLVTSAARKIRRAVSQPAPDLSHLTAEEVAAWDSSDRYAQRSAAKLLEARREHKALARALGANKRPALRG